MFSVEELGQEIADLAVHIDAGTQRLLECIRQFDAECGWAAQGAVSCAHWLAWRIGLDPATAREKVRVARALGSLPTIDQAFKLGRLSYAKVRALTRVATAENEAKLLELALVATGSQLERLCRGYRSALAADGLHAPEERSLRRRELPGGMVKLEIVLSPDEADLVVRALDRAREVGHADAAKQEIAAEGSPRQDVSAETQDEGSPWPSRADGMVALAENFLAGHLAAGNGGERFQVMVHVDQDPLASDGAIAATLDDGTRVSAETLRRVACDCGLVAVSGDGAELNIGRRTRSVPPALRRALALRDHGCVFPGCTHDRFLHGHHIQHWLHGGETSVDNLVLLCTTHHHLVHEGGWSVSRAENGDLLFAAPDGSAVPAEPARKVVEDGLVRLREWAVDRGLDLGPDSNFPQWDGSRPDYDWAVSAMLANG